jgi:2-polyprenyl-3-methyl-5-hydroxy-6-metoxy-1,4-benzoquinol methylase
MKHKTSIQYGDMYKTDRYVRLRFKIYAELLFPFVRSDVKILDIGCYMADLLRILPHNIDYYGIDFDKEALKIAKSRGANVIRADIEHRLPLRSKFDIIVATEILEHLKDPEKMVLQIKNLSDENGVFLISLPNECTLYHRLKMLFGKGIDGTGFAPYYHLHFPTIKQNEEFVSKHFEIIKKRYWIHTGVGGKIEKLLSEIPLAFWMLLANFRPQLFARGVIFLCRLKQKN